MKKIESLSNKNLKLREDVQNSRKPAQERKRSLDEYKGFLDELEKDMKSRKDNVMKIIGKLSENEKHLQIFQQKTHYQMNSFDEFQYLHHDLLDLEKAIDTSIDNIIKARNNDNMQYNIGTISNTLNENLGYIARRTQEMIKKEEKFRQIIQRFSDEFNHLKDVAAKTEKDTMRI